MRPHHRRRSRSKRRSHLKVLLHILDLRIAIINLSDYEYQIGEQIGSALETLWPTEGFWQPGEGAEEALDLIYQAMEVVTADDPPPMTGRTGLRRRGLSGVHAGLRLDGPARCVPRETAFTSS